MKFGRNRADDGTVREPPDFTELDRTLNQHRDEAIKAYAADLRKALGSRGDLERAPS